MELHCDWLGVEALMVNIARQSINFSNGERNSMYCAKSEFAKKIEEQIAATHRLMSGLLDTKDFRFGNDCAFPSVRVESMYAFNIQPLIPTRMGRRSLPVRWGLLRQTALAKMVVDLL